MTADDVATFERCIAVGGVALFPADTVYGLATDPHSGEGVERLYRLKGRTPDRPAAVMFFRLELALAALPELRRAHARSARAAAARRPHALLPNPARRFPLACGADPRAARPAGAAPGGPSSPRWRRSTGRCSSRAPTRAAAPTPRRVDDVDAGIRAGVDLVLDAGELPGHALHGRRPGRLRGDGTFEIVRDGAVRAGGEALADVKRSGAVLR